MKKRMTKLFLLLSIVSAMFPFLAPVAASAADASSGYVLLAHMSSISVKVGQNVSKGTVLGVMGSTGDSTGPHVHVEYTKGVSNNKSDRLNPKDYIDIYAALNKKAKISCDWMCYPNHTGVDLIPEAGGGANVTSPVKGTVVTATYSSSWGNYVRIKITGSSGGSTWNRVAETGRFYPQMTVNVRNAPTTTSPQVAQYYKGESFVYDSYVVNEGYIWLSYVSGSGVRRYVAWRVQGGEKFGYIV